MAQLRAFARVAPDFPALAAWARRLGATTGAPITATEIAGIGTALVDALAGVLGNAFGADERDAWRAGVVLVAELVR